MSLFNEASFILIPSGHEAGKLYAEKPIDGDGDLTWTRNSTANRTNSSGLIESVGANVTRLDYTYGSCPAALLEPQRTNIFRWSEEFDNSSWSKTSLSITPNSITAPDGSTNGMLITCNGTTGIKNITQNLSVVSGVNYTVSVYVKKGSGDYIQITSTATFFGSSVFANYDLYNGVVGSVGSGNIATLIEDVGDGWYRCVLTATAVSTGTSAIGLYPIPSATSGRAPSNTLDTTYYIWGAQFEQGAYATTYIPTTNATVTRLADTAIKTGIQSLIGQTEGTIFLNTRYYSTGTTASGRWFKVFGTSNEIGLAINGVNSVRSIINNQSDTISTAPTSNNELKLAWAYNSSGVVLFINGIQYSIPNGGSQVISSLDSILFDASTNPQFAQAYIYEASVFLTRLTDEELILKTTL